MGKEQPTARIAIEEFINEHAIHLYETEKKRKAYRRSLWIFVPSSILLIPAYLLADFYLETQLAFFLFLPFLVLFGVLAAFFNYNNTEYRTSFKEKILPAFLQSYYPQLGYQHKLGNPKQLFVEHLEGKKRMLIQPIEDHISGLLEGLNCHVYEGMITSQREGTPYEERSLIAEIDHPRPDLLVEFAKEEAIHKFMQMTYRKFQDYPQLFPAKKEKFYITLNMRQKYLEPALTEKVYDGDQLSKTLEELHAILGLIELFGDRWKKYN